MTASHSYTKRSQSGPNRSTVHEFHHPQKVHQVRNYSATASGPFRYPFLEPSTSQAVAAMFAATDCRRHSLNATPRSASNTIFKSSYQEESSARITCTSCTVTIQKHPYSCSIPRLSLKTAFGYVSNSRPEAPSLLRQLVYQEGLPLPSPSTDPEGWKTLRPVSARGVMFKTRPIEARCTVRDQSSCSSPILTIVSALNRQTPILHPRQRPPMLHHYRRPRTRGARCALKSCSYPSQTTASRQVLQPGHHEPKGSIVERVGRGRRHSRMVAAGWRQRK